MNQALVDRIVNSVLYEGYILYPYRPSVKNRQRWTFGGIYPEAYNRLQGGMEPCFMQTECLVAGDAETAVSATVRFLHVVDRKVGAVSSPLKTLPTTEPPCRFVDSLQVGDRTVVSWQEAVERQVSVGAATLEELSFGDHRVDFSFPGVRELEPLRDGDEISGLIVRERQALEGSVTWTASALDDRLFKLRVRIDNCTPWAPAGSPDRDDAVLRALVSTHTILSVQDGEFLSVMDPPERWREQAAGCENIGTYPVLVGDSGTADTLLSSPIILYDYPQVAPESPGDLFDATEIDEILSLRILTMTEDEKRQAAAVDTRAWVLLERTERLAREQLMALHGTIRGMRPVPGGQP